MGDIADRADPETESMLAEARWRAKSEPTLRPTGHCYFCEEPAEPPRLFCGPDCREDFEAEERAIRRAGWR